MRGGEPGGELAERVRFVAEAGKLLTGSLERDEVIAALGRLAVPAAADWASVALREGDAITAASLVHQDPGKVAVVRRTLERFPLRLDAPFGTGRVIATGQPEVIPDVLGQPLERLHGGEAYRRALRVLGWKSLLAVPMRARGRVVGALSLATAESGRRYGEDDLAVAQHVADLAALALDNAALFAAQQRAQATLDAFLHAAPVGLSLTDDDERFVFINERLAAINGVPVEEHLGERVETVLGTELGEKSGALRRRVRTLREPLLDQRIQALDPKGRLRRFEASYVPVELGAGRVGCGGVVTDVTDREEAEAALRRSEERYRTLVDGLPDTLVVAFDPDHDITFVGGPLLEALGHTAKELLGATPAALLPPERAQVLRRHLDAGLAGEAATFDWRSARDGRELEMRTVPLRGGDGEIAEVMLVCRDVTEHKRASDELRDGAARLRTLVETAPDAILGVNGEGRITSANSRIAALLGYAPEELAGQPLELLVPDGFRSAHGVHRARHAPAASTRPLGAGRVLHARRKDGSEVPVEISLGTTPTESGSFTTVVIADITERKRTEQALRDSEARFRAAFEHAPIGVALVEARTPWRFAQVNPALGEILGAAPDELVGLGMLAFLEPDDLEGAYDALARLLAGDADSITLEPRLFRPGGETRWANVSASRVADRGDAATHLVLQVEDISDRKRFEGQLQHLADHDSLTGLFNRRRFEEELERALAHVERYGDPAALLVIDLDNFKAVNDAHGHAAGDDLLVRIAGVLRARLRETDVLGRLGGDEFAVVLERTNALAAALVAEELVGALGPAFAGEDERAVRATASIGIAAVDPDTVASAEELLVHADLAMYDAKEAGRNRVAVADAAAGRQHQLRARMRWTQRIQHALDTESFVLASQPILDLRTDTIDRHELLLRMPDDTGDLVPPGVFLYVAEHSGQIHEIDRWVVSRATALLAELGRAGATDVLEVNLSGATLTDTRTMDAIIREVAAADIDHSRLVLEVTETAAIVNVDRAREFAKRLAALGCRFALDDFGAGFGSFYYLKHLPFDALKIDGDFIRELATNPRDQLTVKAIVDIARGLGKKTIAEYVEDAPTLRLLRELGVDYAQGYHVGRPQPLEGEGGAVGRRFARALGRSPQA